MDPQAATQAPSSSYHMYFQAVSSYAIASEGYFVGGNFYQSWDNISRQNNVAPIKGEDRGKIGGLNFRF